MSHLPLRISKKLLSFTQKQ